MSSNLNAAVTSASELVEQVEAVVQSLTTRNAELELQLTKVGAVVWNGWIMDLSTQIDTPGVSADHAMHGSARAQWCSNVHLLSSTENGRGR